MQRKMIFWIALVCLTVLVGCWITAFAEEAKQPEKTEEKKEPEKKKDFEDFDKVIKDSKSYEGFFKLYQKKTNLYCEIQPDQLDKSFLCMISISRGIGRYPYAGTTLDDWVLAWRRVGDRRCPARVPFRQRTQATRSTHGSQG